MTLEERLEDAGFFFDGEENVLTIDGFDDAVIGVSANNEIIYDYEKMVLVLMQRDDMTASDAREYLDYNVLFTRTSGAVNPVIMFRI